MTLDPLLEHLQVSGPQIKISVRGVCGVSFYDFIRMQKMGSVVKRRLDGKRGNPGDRRRAWL